MTDPRPRRALLLHAFVVTVLQSHAASAHTLGISSGEYRAEGRTVAIRLAFAVADGVRLVPGLDGDGDRRVSAAEVARARDDVARLFAERLVVLGDSRPCVPSLTDVALTEGDGLLVDLAYTCESGPRSVDVDVVFVDALDAAHRHVARTVGAATADVLLTSASRRVSFRPKDAEPPEPPADLGSHRWIRAAVVATLLLTVAAFWKMARRRALLRSVAKEAEAGSNGPPPSRP